MSGELVGQNRLAAQIGGWKGQIAEARSDRLSADKIDVNEWPEPLQRLLQDYLPGQNATLEVIAEALVALVEITASKPENRSVFNGSDDDGRGTE